MSLLISTMKRIVGRKIILPLTIKVIFQLPYKIFLLIYFNVELVSCTDNFFPFTYFHDKMGVLQKNIQKCSSSNRKIENQKIMPSLISTMRRTHERKNLQQKRCPHKLPRLEGHLYTLDFKYSTKNKTTLGKSVI